MTSVLRQNRRGIVRATLIFAMAEALAYVIMFLYEGSMLSKGAANALTTANVRIGSIVLLSGTRTGDVSRVSVAGWLIPALVVLPLLVAMATVLARRSIGAPRQV